MIAEGDGFRDKPFGSSGEMLPTPSPTERPPPPTPLRIDPPPWQEQLEAGTFDLSALDPPSPAPLVPPALGDFDPPPPQGPPVVLEPLARPTFPEPDWRAEERERQQLEDERRLADRRLIYEQELARIADDSDQPESRPAKRKGQP